MIEENDWRLTCADEKFLKGLKLKKIKFPEFWQKAYLEKNDFYRKIADDAENYVNAFHKGEEYLQGEKVQAFWHEHCLFCWEKFMTDMNTECFCSHDYYSWICKDCFEDFKEMFGFSVTDD